MSKKSSNLITCGYKQGSFKRPHIARNSLKKVPEQFCTLFSVGRKMFTVQKQQ